MKKLSIGFEQVRTVDKPHGEKTRVLVFGFDDGELKIRLTISGELDVVSAFQNELECGLGNSTTFQIGGPPPGQAQLPQ